MPNGWYSAQELAGLPGMPGDRTNVLRASKKNLWPSRNKLRGKGLEYPLSCLPDETQEALLARELSLPALGAPATTAVAVPPAPTFFPQACADLTDDQRIERDARAGVVAAIRRFQVEAGCSQEAAMQTLLALAASGRADPIIVRSLQLARDGRGRKGNGLPSTRTLKRWLSAGDLTPRVAQRDMSIPPWAKAFLERYQQPQKPSVEAAYRDACNAWSAQGYEGRPSIHQVRRFLDKLGTVTRERGRMGPRELKNIQPFIRRDFSHLEPNDIWSADGHTFDAEVQHPYHGRPFRPEITSIVDIATRRLVGWSVGLAESAVGVVDALRHASEFAGLCATFYVDNGSGFDNAMLSDAGTGLAGRLGFEVRHSLPYNSQARGVIERLHKTVWVEDAKMLPSYMGAAMDREARLAQFKLTRQALKNGGSMPLIPWDVFMDFCRARVADYNARGHRSLGGVSPDLKWREFELKGWQPHTLCASDLDTLFRPRVERKIARGEIILFTNIYACPKLEEFHGDSVQVAYDMHRPEKVWVYTPQGKFMGEAICDGNRRHYYPVAVVQQDREKRAAGRLKRVQASAAEIREELRGPALEAPKENEIVIGGPAMRIDDAVALGRELIDAPAATPKVAVATPDVAPKTAPLPRSARPIAEVVDEWQALDARIAAGAAVDDDDAYWHGSVQKNPAWRAEMKRRAEEGRAQGEDTQGRRVAV